MPKSFSPSLLKPIDDVNGRGNPLIDTPTRVGLQPKYEWEAKEQLRWVMLAFNNPESKFESYLSVGRVVLV